MQKIMIIEDDSAIREELVLLLKNEGYCPFPVVDFTDIPKQAKQLCPDLILLDIGLPGQDGFSLCADLRRSGAFPVIFVTSRELRLSCVEAEGLWKRRMYWKARA